MTEGEHEDSLEPGSETPYEIYEFLCELDEDLDHSPDLCFGCFYHLVMASSARELMDKGQFSVGNWASLVCSHVLESDWGDE